MAIDPALDQLSREELIVRARALGARRPELMTRVELRDEIVRLSEADPAVRRRTRGWLGVARDLVASVVDSGLNLPGAAAAIRGEAKPEHEWQGPPPVATVTLAEIYVAQGHTDRALAVLSEVLANEPDHAAALALRHRLERRGEPLRVVPPARVAPETEDLTPARPVNIATVADDVAPEGASLEDEPPLTPPPSQASFAEGVPPREEAFGSTEQGTQNPFPDEPSPLTAEHSILPGEPAPYVEEKTVRGLVNLLPERPACAVVASAFAVEAFYELPVGVTDAVLRVVWYTPGVGEPERGERDLAVEPGYHRVAVEGVPESAQVRAALGVTSSNGFVPLAVAWVYGAGGAGPTLAFAPPGQETPTLRARVEARVVALR